MQKNFKMKELKFLSLASLILFFLGCSEDNKHESSQIPETEDILLSYELSVEEVISICEIFFFFSNFSTRGIILNNSPTLEP